jgi:hypothetical protein
LPFPLASGTILHFRSFGLIVNKYKPPPSQRYQRIDKELGRGNLPVYKANPTHTLPVSSHLAFICTP